MRIKKNQTNSNGEREGLWNEVVFGNLMRRGHYHKGRKEGLWEEYYKRNGQVVRRITFVNGVIEGPINYYKDGNISYSFVKYKNNVLLEEFYDGIGKLKLSRLHVD